MACNSEFIEFVCSQIADAGEIRFRKMFGDYVIYVKEKPVITACDGICYVKKHPSIQSLMENAECGHPYEGAKEHYILDISHRDHALQVIRALWKMLPFSKGKVYQRTP